MLECYIFISNYWIKYILTVSNTCLLWLKSYLFLCVCGRKILHESYAYPVILYVSKLTSVMAECLGSLDPIF